ncbi:MAG TPA: SH3 domain-containing protein, partial [Thermomicrobiales bacterium]|nr:SH3 domain-containing protein [Thermomicrobiales bacterium]
LVGADYAVDVRVDAADPATSIACGSIGGVLGGQISGTELAIGLRERNQSGNGGIAWFRQDNDRTVVNVFVAQGLEEGAAIGGVLAPPAQPTAAATSAPTTEATAEATTATQAQAALTPTVTVIEAPSPTPGAAAATPAAAANYQVGDHVVTTTDVNLRAAPNTDAAVVTILGTGADLEVTGAPQGDWIPVRDVATGRRGFVSAEFVQPMTA